jgi:broad specificity phosphatase PhoE
MVARTGRHAFELIVVRHGRTAWNATGRFQGQTDVPLDDEGRAQGRALARMLATQPLDRAVASDLSRAAETARLILAGRNVALALDPLWREMRFGTWEGLTWKEITAGTPELPAGSETKPRTYTPPGGETFDELCARTSDALGAVEAASREGECVLVATHAGVLHALLRVALGESEATALGVRFSPGSLTRLALGPGGAKLLELNRTAGDEARS